MATIKEYDEKNNYFRENNRVQAKRTNHAKAVSKAPWRLSSSGI